MGMEALINLCLLAFLAIAALGIASIRNLFAVAMLSGIFSLLCACVFVLLDAVDVAFTEAAVGAGMTTVLFLATFALTSKTEKPTATKRSLPALLVVSFAGFLLLYASQDMPGFGTADAPVQTHPLASHFLETSVDEIGVPNVVTSVLASYRGYDTLGEVIVVFTAGIGVIMLLGLGRRGPTDTSHPHTEIQQQQMILRIITKLMLPLILLFALYVQFHGDYGPGGGFQAGVIFAAGIILYGMVFGLDATRRVLPVRFLVLLVPLGALLYAGVGITNLILGGEFLNYNSLDPEYPVHGQHLGILLVELGVGITVTAVMISLFMAFAGRGRQQS